MNEKKDLRVIKTNMNLYNSLVLLLKEKPFEEIKVSDICEKALINRSTFYSHYTDKYELFDSFIKELKISLINKLNTNKSDTNTKTYYIELITLLMDHIEERKEIYASIMLNNKNSVIMDMVYDTLTSDIKELLNENKKNNAKLPNDIVASFYIGAVFNIGIEWLKNNFKYSKEDIINYVCKLLPDNI